MMLIEENMLSKIKSMETVLRTTEEEQCLISKAYGRSEGQIKEDVNAIREWLKKQPHLPPDIDDNFIEKKLFWNKYSLEKTKKKIDMYFSVRNMVPEFFADRDLTSPSFQHHLSSVMILCLPKLTKELSRVSIFSHLNNNPDNFNFELNIRFLCAQADFRMLHDSYMSDILILDLGNATFAHVLKSNPVILKKLMTVLQKAYSDRIAAVHFINLPSYAEPLVTGTKFIMKDKRLFVHKNIESLHQMVSPEILPVEYGGTERSTVELYAECRKVLESNNDWIMEIGAKRSNEKLRLGEPLDSDMFGGIHSSFRRLDVD